MKKLIFAGALAMLSQSIPAIAATSEHYQFKGENAIASFEQLDGCTTTYVNVFAFDAVSKNEPGAPISQKEVNVSYSTYNYCTGTGSYGYGSTPASLTMDNQLRQASVNATFTLTDINHNNNSTQPKTVSLSLNWTGTGDTFRGHSHFRNTGPGYTSNYRSVGADREAQVSGSFILDGTNLIGNEAIRSGHLYSSSSGTVIITRR